MPNTYIKTAELRQDGRSWSVVINGAVVESGHGNASGAALAALAWWHRNYREAETCWCGCGSSQPHQEAVSEPEAACDCGDCAGGGR